MIVSKDKKKFIAEVKSGKAASIETINNRRQLLEYTKVFYNKNLNILVLIVVIIQFIFFTNF